MKRPHLELPREDREYLEQLVSKGEAPVRLVKRALALLALDRGETLESVAAHQQVENDTVAAWRNRYKCAGLPGLQDKPKPGRPPRIDGVQRAQITALACSDAPEGHGQWSLRLLADKVVELGYSEKISHMQVGRILKKTK
jgi:putative transposase